MKKVERDIVVFRSEAPRLLHNVCRVHLVRPVKLCLRVKHDRMSVENEVLKLSKLSKYPRRQFPRGRQEDVHMLEWSCRTMLLRH